jgi:hypothetical protein
MFALLSLLILGGLVSWAFGLKQAYAGYPQMSLWSAGAMLGVSALMVIASFLLQGDVSDGLVLVVLLIFGAVGAAAGLVCAIIAGVVYGARPTKSSGSSKE